MSSEDKITADDLLNAMAEADALETFVQLPRSSQDKFHAWIGRARDNESHWRRIETLVLAMKAAPPGNKHGDQYEGPSTGAFEG